MVPNYAAGVRSDFLDGAGDLTQRDTVFRPRCGNVGREGAEAAGEAPTVIPTRRLLHEAIVAVLP
jgi:hypothetical protein